MELSVEPCLQGRVLCNSERDEVEDGLDANQLTDSIELEEESSCAVELEESAESTCSEALSEGSEGRARRSA